MITWCKWLEMVLKERQGVKISEISPRCHLIIVSGDPDKDIEFKDGLVERGFEVTFCADTKRILPTIERIMPKFKTTVLVVDVCLPAQSGFEIVRRLSEQYRQDQLSVIMMSRHSCSEDRLEATNVGAIDLLKKPITAYEVEALLEKERMRKFKNEIGNLVFDISYE